ncbi:MAG TPA: superoxide dismutase family protein [Mycolicibacillus parakoreensis]|nr:superoxide dismutase family protein [Mycolicibacillus parakoreensis]
MLTSRRRPAVSRSAPTVALAALAAPVLLLSACSPNEPEAPGPGPAPSVWTGSPATAPESHDGTDSDTLRAQLSDVDGTPVATAEFDFTEGYVTVTIQTVEGSVLTPGFHGTHLHEVGKCEADSTAPTGGEPGAFLSAGGHFQAPGHHGHPQSGDLTALQVRSDGTGYLVTTTDAFNRDELLAGEGTAIIIHADDDNFAHIPSERYVQLDGTPGPDQTTLKTGDAGQRVACGVINAG